MRMIPELASAQVTRLHEKLEKVTATTARQDKPIVKSDFEILAFLPTKELPDVEPIARLPTNCHELKMPNSAVVKIMMKAFVMARYFFAYGCAKDAQHLVVTMCLPLLD